MSINGPSKIVREGLVLLLDAANVKSYSGSGTSWYDMSKNGHHATATNGPTFTSDGAKSYWSFDGINDYFSTLGTDNYVDLFTIVNVTGAGGTLPMLFSSTTDADKSLRFEAGDYIRSSTTSALVDPNDWQYGQTADVFINGKFNQAGTSCSNRWVFLRSYRSNVNFTNPFNCQISGVYSGARYFNGKLNFIAAYNRKLTDQEVIRNFNATRTRFGV